MYLSGSQNIQKSMNGLLRIRATEIDCDTATIDTINGLQNIDAKIGENIIISTDANQNVQFKSDVSMNYDLDVSGNTKLKNLNVANSTTLYLLSVNEEANFNNNVYVNDATLDVKGTFMNRDMADPTRTMSLYYDPGFYGFRFRNDNLGGYLYFSVLDFAGNMKSFQFNHSQVYSNIKMYIDNTLNQGFGQPFYQGDANSDIGGKIIFVPSTNATDGWQFINRFPGLSFYTNFACANVAGTNYQTFRMNYNNLWSLVPHTFNSSATFNSSLNASSFDCSNNAVFNGSSIFNGSSTFNGVLNATGTTFLQATTISGSLTSDFFSYFNKDINLNGTTKLFVNGTTGITQNELSYLSGVSSNIQTQLNNKLNLSGGSISGTLTVSGGITGLSTLAISGSAQLNGAVLLGTTTLLNNNILQYGSSIINQDTSGTYSGTNMLKLTNILQNTTGSATPTLIIQDTGNDNSIYILANSDSGSWNNLNSLNSMSITGHGSNQNSASLVLTTWSTLKNGVKISATSSTNAQTELWAGNSSNIILNNSTGVTVNNTASITYTDSSIQTTAYTSTLNTKLLAIGTIVSSTLNATTTLTTNTIFNCGSISLTAGTWSVSINCCVAVITGTTTVGELLAGYSTSSTGLSQTGNLSIINAGSFTYNVGNQWCLTSTNTIVVSSTTTYYMLTRCLFGTASRMRFVSTNSAFQATRIA